MSRMFGVVWEALVALGQALVVQPVPVEPPAPTSFSGRPNIARNHPEKLCSGPLLTPAERAVAAQLEDVMRAYS